jgi:urease accessory protein
MNDLASLPTTDLSPPRARGTARVSTRLRDGISVLDGLHQSGSMRVLFPRPASPPTAMLLNTAGGITGGDRFSVSATAGQGACLTVTTQAAERAYRAPPGPPGELLNEISVEDRARLDWLPQETILFEGCDLTRSLDVTLANTAEALIVEPLIFGRAAHGERLHNARFSERVRIRQGGRVIYADGMRLAGDIAAQMAAPAMGAEAGALVTLILASPSAPRWLEPLRAHIAATPQVRAGASCLTEQLLLMRALAHDGFELRRLLLPVLDDLTGGALPICWRL